MWLRRFFYSLYLPQPGLDWSDPRISPKYADVEAYPPTTIVTCEKDALGQEGKEVVEKLKSAGKDVVHWEVPGQGHGWDKVRRRKRLIWDMPELTSSCPTATRSHSNRRDLRSGRSAHQESSAPKFAAGHCRRDVQALVTQVLKHPARWFLQRARRQITADILVKESQQSRANI